MCKICALAARFQHTSQGNEALLTTANLSTVISQSFSLSPTRTLPQSDQKAEGKGQKAEGL